MESLRKQARDLAEELVCAAGLKPGDVLVVGCSSSEIVGKKIGTESSTDAADAVFDGIYSVTREKGLRLAAQCCEHLNRALIVEAETASALGLPPVMAVPHPKAGGSFATAAYRAFAHPVAVEHIRAQAGLDIGGTLIGMHLQEVAVPLRLSCDHLGNAIILCAKTRPKYIGGPRTQYE